MKDLDRSLDEILGHKNRISVLRAIISERKGSPGLIGVEIEKKSGLTHAGCHRALKDVSRLGIVSEERIGRSILYTFNRRNYYSKIIFDLLNRERLL